MTERNFWAGVRASLDLFCHSELGEKLNEAGQAEETGIEASTIEGRTSKLQV